MFGTPDEIARMLRGVADGGRRVRAVHRLRRRRATAPLRARDHAGLRERIFRARGGMIEPGHDRPSQTPRSRKDVEDAVRWARRQRTRPWRSSGRARSARIGRPSQTDITLDLSGLSGVTLYEPDELVLSAQRRHAARRDRRAARRQRPAACLRADGLRAAVRLASAAGHASAASSPRTCPDPRRIKAGAARDHFLGVTAVTGRGETIKSGGRVVKNVTGYDLCKVFAGSWGTLAAMTDVTLKVLPQAGDGSDGAGRGPRRRAGLRRDGRRDGLGLRRLRRGASARPRRRPVSTGCPKRGGRHRAAARGLRAVGEAPQETLAALMKPFGAVAAAR